MNENKITKAERLFDAIGGIDDRIIAEAAAPYEKKRRRVTFARIATVAASFALCVGILGGVISRLSSYGSEEDMAPEMSDSIAAITLTSTLYSYRGSPSVLRLRASDIDLFDGVMKIIWSYAGESEYNVVKVPRGREESVSEMISKDHGGVKLSSAEAEEIECSLWICDGNGVVVSPYLEASDGNVGYGVLFEYSPEIEPSSEFSYLINDLIS